MILFIIFSLLVTLVSLLTLKVHKDMIIARDKNEWITKSRKEGLFDVLSVLTYSLFAVYVVFLILTITLIALKPTLYIRVVEEKYSIEARLEVYLESDKEIDFKDISWQVLYKDIKDYNAIVKIHKYWSSNIFFNWYYSRRVGELELIDYKGT